jgi:hypothetical protein
MKSKRVYKYEFKDGGDLAATGARHISIAKANNNVSCIVIAANAFGYLTQNDIGGTAGSYAKVIVTGDDLSDVAVSASVSKNAQVSAGGYVVAKGFLSISLSINNNVFGRIYLEGGCQNSQYFIAQRCDVDIVRSDNFVINDMAKRNIRITPVFANYPIPGVVDRSAFHGDEVSYRHGQAAVSGTDFDSHVQNKNVYPSNNAAILVEFHYK